ncbi:MAG: hypothetical protein WBN14_08635 [Polyangiales bacterium]
MMSLSRTAVLGVLTTCLHLALPQTATSQEIDPGPWADSAALVSLAGSYRYAGTPADDHAKIDASIQAAVSSLGWLGRRVAASRLANHKELPQRIVIARRGDDVSITMGKYDAVAALDGSPKELVAPNGRDAKLSYRVTTDEILQFFVFEHATRKSTYRRDGEGRLVMSVFMTSEKLASPIVYDLVYEKDDP